MTKKIITLFCAVALALSACGTLQVASEQTPTVLLHPQPDFRYLGGFY